MNILKSATKLFLLGVGFCVCIAFMIIVFMNTSDQAIIASVTGLMGIIVGAVMGYFFKHNEPNGKEPTTPSSQI